MGGYLPVQDLWDIPLDDVAFSRLNWLTWGCIFNWVANMGSHIRGFGGKKILVGRDYKIRTFLFNFFLTSINIVCTQFDDDDNWHRITYYGVKALRGQRHMLAKIDPGNPSPGNIAQEEFWAQVNFVASECRLCSHLNKNSHDRGEHLRARCLTRPNSGCEEDWGPPRLSDTLLCLANFLFPGLFSFWVEIFLGKFARHWWKSNPLNLSFFLSYSE